MRRRGILGTALALPFAIPAARAQDARPIRLVIAFPAGGPTDVIGRLVAEKMARALGQTVVVENRGGANGNIAAEAVARAEADGSVLLYNTSSIAISRALYRRLSYDLLRDLAPVALTASAPSLLVADPRLPVRNAAEFIAWARANSGKISYGSGGVGNVSHLQAFMVMRHIGAEATHVPYRGTAAALTDVAAGNVQFMSDAFNTALPQARDGLVRAIAVSSLARAPLLPEVPTMAETGLMPPGSDTGIWQGIMAPARTPPEAIARLNGAVNSALRDEEVRKRLAAMGATPSGGTAGDYARYLAAEVALWARVVQESGATAE
ncbi:Bug family tripartite tricarboxylate transporter substrate binding protein [Paracraurococcus ruber]|uniref:LacI family transcriptional regulator n=1 Tax=Paracraurococcus ruber TaxID=77675 RepID=A0ABS1CRW1_9PROT|nr:tripartite tricarboxylate transporter substrate-binding protein [Paracraurococcus ruber]MBK1657192.1 LacI family transcriptional regulator [Paracraurococcus ruber]TDG11205.1 tripartite tricarboxylate transporter substrate binding protein [Paracraurococcus ruber]